MTAPNMTGPNMTKPGGVRLGVIVLAHQRLDRVAQVVSHWLAAGVPVVVHIDRSVPTRDWGPLRSIPSPLLRLRSDRRCHWGQWGIVQATLDSAKDLLCRDKSLTHVLLTSGSCLLLRPVKELVAHLDAHDDTDFIESYRASDVPAGKIGLTQERTSLTHPFPFRWRYVFDKNVEIQRRLGVSRRVPKGVTPHIGSQWWCLTRQTLQGIVSDPDGPAIARYYRRSWVPDEGFFQTMARRWARRITGTSLTASTFDVQGKPRIFYDDHTAVLRDSAAFLARKAWPDAEVLYRRFPSPAGSTRPDHGKLASMMAPRPGAPLVLQATHVAQGLGLGRPLHVIGGIGLLFRDLAPWIEAGGLRVGGRIMRSDAPVPRSLGVSESARDADPVSFLRNACQEQALDVVFLEAEDLKASLFCLAKDPDVTVHIVSGAWLALRADPATAAAWQKQELQWLEALQSVGARHSIWTLAECLKSPDAPLASVAQTFRTPNGAPLPSLRPLPGLSYSLAGLQQAGVAPRVFGALPISQVSQRSGLRRVVGE